MVRGLTTDGAIFMGGSILMMMESNPRKRKGKIKQKEVDKFPVHHRIETGLLDQPKKDTVLPRMSPQYHTW
jgi:hypothetical protein